MGLQIADAKAPWVMFERRAVEDRAASIEQGHYVAKDVDFVLVTPHGSKDQIEREVNDWFQNMEQQVNEQRLDPNWLDQYKRGYKNWKEGKETPVEGTAIINWPMISPSQVKMLQDLHILTVETLANANEESIRRMGMGGRALVQKAAEYIKQAQNGGKATEQILALQAKMDAMQKTIDDQAAALAKIPAPTGETKGREGDGSAIGADDLGLGKKL